MDAGRRWQIRQASWSGKTVNEWLASMTVPEYQELIELSRIEPVGVDALIHQMAVVAQAIGGGKLDDCLVLSTLREMSPEEIARKFGWNGNDSKS